ncbi:MAG: hypothetical protein BM556_00930 [Bacteriovorax sp. MedPE-SWde]|nr:MAG: hypothetical protein BM556_00930 [Bacteriovorax sp. MedPE-SWde]
MRTKLHQQRSDLYILLILCVFNIAELSIWTYAILGITLFAFYFLNGSSTWKRVKQVIAIISFPLFCLLYGAIKQIEPAVCTISVLALLKYTEISSIRDRLSFYTLLIVFISGSVLLSDQIAYLIVSLVSIIYIFYKLGEISGIKYRRIHLVKLLIPSLIFSVFIFFLVPQVKVGNIFKYMGNRKAVSGFSTSISPGSYNEVVTDDSIFFFSKYRNLPETGYWRGMTYNYTNGRKWVQRNVKVKERIVDEVANPDLEVNVLSNQKVPVFKLQGHSLGGLNGSLNVYENKFFDTTSQRGQIRRYELHKTKQATLRSFDKAALQYPKKNMSKRFLDFIGAPINDKNENSINTNEAVEVLLSKFKKLNLSYSTKTQIDESSDPSKFLFDYKQGYCIHFAGAFALGLRVMGIPANVIGGFFGGELNRAEKYILVKGGNAHAWIEYWNGSNWVEFDPVSEIVPSSQLPRNDLLSRSSNEIDQNLLNEGIISKFFDQIEGLYLYSNMKFFEFDIEKQISLLVTFQNELKTFSIRSTIKESQWIFPFIGLTILLFLSILMRRRFLLEDKYFLERLIDMLNLRKFNGISNVRLELDKVGISKELLDSFENEFNRSNYSNSKNTSKEYRELKRMILREVKNHNRTL